MTMGHGVGILLIALAAGYWVLTLADKERGQLKKVGKALGLIIIGVSLVGTACKIYVLTKGGQPFPGKGLFCPSGRSCPFVEKSGS